MPDQAAFIDKRYIITRWFFFSLSIQDYSSAIYFNVFFLRLSVTYCMITLVLNFILVQLLDVKYSIFGVWAPERSKCPAWAKSKRITMLSVCKLVRRLFLNLYCLAVSDLQLIYKAFRLSKLPTVDKVVIGSDIFRNKQFSWWSPTHPSFLWFHPHSVDPFWAFCCLFGSHFTTVQFFNWWQWPTTPKSLLCSWCTNLLGTVPCSIPCQIVR